MKGHEFHRACANVGGEFIQISPASPHCINVMEIRKVDRSVNELLDGPGIQLSELAAKIQQLHIFFSLLIPDMSHEERQLLDEALIRTYNAKGITHDNASLDDPANPGQYREMPVLGDLHEILKAAPETTRMAHILNRLVHGSASTFNKQTNVSLDNKYTVLDISSLTGDLLTVGMFVALDFVWDRAKADRTEEKTIFIDECWQLLSGAGATGTRLAGDFLLEIAKTIRGYQLCRVSRKLSPVTFKVCEIQGFFFLSLGVTQSLICSAAGMIHTEYHKVASIHHLPVANLNGTLRMAASGGAAQFNFIIICFKVLQIVP